MVINDWAFLVHPVQCTDDSKKLSSNVLRNLDFNMAFFSIQEIPKFLLVKVKTLPYEACCLSQVNLSFSQRYLKNSQPRKNASGRQHKGRPTSTQLWDPIKYVRWTGCQRPLVLGFPVSGSISFSVKQGFWTRPGVPRIPDSTGQEADLRCCHTIFSGGWRVAHGTANCFQEGNY